VHYYSDIVDRNTLIQLLSRISEPAEEEQRCAPSAPSQGTAQRRPLLLREDDQPLGEIMGPLELS
jgi:hypothetical protein